MLLHDREIRRRCGLSTPLISPFSEGVSEGGVISYGLTSGGYDLRLDRYIMVFKGTRGDIVDPKAFRQPAYRELMFDCYSVELGEPFVLPAHSYVLVQSLEYINMPWDLKGRCVGKSTYARCGVIVNTTPLEPEWHGTLTVEISNSNPSPVRIYTGEGIAQLEFEQLLGLPQQTYATKGGKYQGQTEVTPARIK